jgi:threonine synthase
MKKIKGMKFYNINDINETTSFREAVLKGAASGRGLYFPSVIPRLPESFFKEMDDLSLPELASYVLEEYVKEDFSREQIHDICRESFNFNIPLVHLENNMHALELFHGPSLAFKDVGARFLSEVLKKIAFQEEEKVTVLVATSGDTGSAVAKSFHNVEGVQVILLYPSGKVSDLQEKTLTTMGGNIHTAEVEGSFDDCQRLVKTAFADDHLNKVLKLTSANSINIGRFLPQSVYYFWAWKQLPPEERSNLVISVPSGNYGNLTAGILAYKMGLPIKRFIAASNINKVIPDYLVTGRYEPRQAESTLSNAMDVGDPSNFVRIKELFHNNVEEMRGMIRSEVVTDDQTRETINRVYKEYGYLLDPHGAVGYRGCKNHLESGETGVFIETAHPGKFKNTVEEAIGEKMELPGYLKEVQQKEKKTVRLAPAHKDFKDWLMSL